MQYYIINMTQKGWTHVLVRDKTKNSLKITLNEIQKRNESVNSQDKCLDFLIKFFWKFYLENSDRKENKNC